MPRSCTICSHPQRAALETALRDETSLRDIARQYAVSKDGLARHKASHMVVAEKRDRPTDRPRRQGIRIAPEVKPATQAAFLAAFIELANESGACRAVSIDRSTVRQWEEHDAAFSLKYQDAREQVNDSIRGEIFRRAKTGYDEEVATPKGDVVTIHKYSDRLMEFLAKARMSEFREKQQLDVTSNGQTVGQLNLEQLASLMATMPADLAAWRRDRFTPHE